MSSIRRSALSVALFWLIAVAPGAALALENGHFIVDPATGFAASGFDPVAFFVDGALRDGKPDHEASWAKAAWRFANEGNRDAFVRDPLVYAPRYGGHCPVAMARGYPAEGDPRVWTIYENRLYFFYSQDNLRAFAADPGRIVAEAQATWNRLFPF